MASKIRVMIKHPGEVPKIEAITADFATYQQICGGYVEDFRLSDDVILLCDEEGRLKQKPYCFNWGRVKFFGDVIFVGYETVNGEQIICDFPYDSPMEFYQDMLVRGFVPA